MRRELGQRAKIKKTDIPQEIRQKLAEPSLVDPQAEEIVEIVEEVAPDVVKVRYRGEIFPVSKSHLKLATNFEQIYQEYLSKLSGTELLREYTSLRRGGGSDPNLSKKLRMIEHELSRRSPMSGHFAMSSPIDKHKLSWLESRTRKKSISKSKSSTKRFSVWDILENQIIRREPDE